jgi:hypothetical protein
LFQKLGIPHRRKPFPWVRKQLNIRCHFLFSAKKKPRADALRRVLASSNDLRLQGMAVFGGQNRK